MVMLSGFRRRRYPPKITSCFTANKGSPQAVGTAITWTCKSYGSGTLRFMPGMFIVTGKRIFKRDGNQSGSNKFTYNSHSSWGLTMCVLFVRDPGDAQVKPEPLTS